MSAVKNVSLVAEQQPLQPVETPTDQMVAMIERLALSKDVDVDKFAKLLDLQERIITRQAEADFNAAFASMQGDLPTVTERGKGDKNMRYARLEDIIAAVRPVLQQHGFSISHRTEWPDAKTVRVVGILTHRGGHSRQSEFMSTADQSGSKNAIQALGSSVSYGRRYTTKDLLNIATSDEDDDGRKAGEVDVKDSSVEGFEDWLDSMEAAAEQGTAPLMAAWNKASKAFKDQLGRARWERMKADAEKASKSERPAK